MIDRLPTLLLAFFVGSTALAQRPVPIEDEPRHHLILENRYVRVFSVEIPPGDVSLFHTHRHSGVSIRLGDAKIKDEPLNKESTDITVKLGAVAFALNPTPLVHRVSNIGQTPFRNIFVELLSPPGPVPTSPLSEGSRHRLELENDLVRVYRLTLAPGDSTDDHLHDAPVVTIAVTAGTVSLEKLSGESRLELKEGEARWEVRGVSQRMRNVGIAPFEAVEIELK